MVFLANLEGEERVFAYGLFGVQHEILTAEKHSLISTLYSLLADSAGRVDHLQDENHGLPQRGPTSTTFVAYWLRAQDYDQWKESKQVKDFWTNLPNDAGVWREVMKVPKSRFMHASNQDIKSGIATLLELKHSTDEGYWGVYRHRLTANPDIYTDPADTFTSHFVTAQSSDSNSARPVLNLPSSSSKAVKLGRTQLSKIPDDLCFVREGQRQPNISKEELDIWLESIAPHAKSWIQHLDTERAKNGVVCFTTHLGHENPVSNVAIEKRDALMFDTDAVAETNQFAYFLDLAHFEKAGRSHRGHVQLRKNVMSLYGPGGKLSEGKAVLFVELCILKSGDLDAEYIGCTEGTGLMHLADI